MHIWTADFVCILNSSITRTYLINWRFLSLFFLLYYNTNFILLSIIYICTGGVINESIYIYIKLYKRIV